MSLMLYLCYSLLSETGEFRRCGDVDHIHRDIFFS